MFLLEPKANYKFRVTPRLRIRGCLGSLFNGTSSTQAEYFCVVSCGPHLRWGSISQKHKATRKQEPCKGAACSTEKKSKLRGLYAVPQLVGSSMKNVTQTRCEVGLGFWDFERHTVSRLCAAVFL